MVLKTIRIPAALSIVVGAGLLASLAIAAAGVAGAEHVRSALAQVAPVLARDAQNRTIIAALTHLQRVELAGLVVLAALSIGSALLAFVGRRWLDAKVVHPLDDAMQAVSALALGDLREKIVIDDRTQARRLFAALAQMQHGLIETLTLVTDEAIAVDNCASSLSSQNRRLSASTESQAAAVQQTAATTQQISEAAQRSAQTAAQTNQLAENASRLADESRTQVRAVIDAIHSISQGSRQIGDIVSVVNSLAFQTNILALNAAVEAARAGHQGKGFAVVASEVRSLAQKSASAAREIEALIANARSSIENGARLCTNVRSAMDEVVASAHEVVQLSDDMSRSAREQSHGAQQLNDAIRAIDSVTQQNTQVVQHLVGTTEDLTERARALTNAVGSWKLGR